MRPPPRQKLKDMDAHLYVTVALLTNSSEREGGGGRHTDRQRQTDTDQQRNVHNRTGWCEEKEQNKNWWKRDTETYRKKKKTGKGGGEVD